MSFLKDSSPLVKAVLAVGVLGVLYVVSARIISLPPYACQDGMSYDGVLWGDCVGGSQQRGLQEGEQGPTAQEE